MNIKKISLALLASLSLSLPAFAELERGIEAYLNHDLVKSHAEFLETAQEGDPDSAFMLGMLALETGYSSTTDSSILDEAEKWLQKAAELGSGEAAYNLALFYLQDEFLDSSKKKFEQYLARAKALNYIDAYLLLMKQAALYEDRFGEPDANEMYRDLKAAYTLSPTPDIGMLYGIIILSAAMEDIPNDVDTTDIPKDAVNMKMAVDLLEKALSAGTMVAAVPLVDIYQKGTRNFKANPKRGKVLEAMLEKEGFAIFLQMQDFIDVTPVSILTASSIDLEEFQETLTQKSETDGDSAYRLASFYENGIFKHDNHREMAITYFEKAALLGDFRGLKALSQLSSYEYDAKKSLMPLLEKGIKEKDAQSFYLMAELRATNYREGIYDRDLARRYLLQAANLGYLEAIKTLTAAYATDSSNDYRIEKDLNESLKWGLMWQEKDPENRNLSQILIQVLSELNAEEYREDYSDQIAFNIAKIEDQSFQNEPTALVIAIADFYSSDQKYQDSQRAFTLYDQLLQKDPQTRDRDYLASQKAILLKYGGNNLSKDEAKAFQILSEIDAREDYNDVKYELADMYHHGKGTAVDLEKAMTFYGEGDLRGLKPLGELWMMKDSVEDQNQGARYYIRALQRSWDDEIVQILLNHPHLTYVQDWLYDVYKNQDIVLGKRAYELIKEGDINGLPSMQFHYAKILREIPSEKANADAKLDALIAQKYLPAMKERANSYWSDKILLKVELLKTIAAESDEDGDWQNLADAYNRISEYELAVQAIENIEDHDRSFLGSITREAKSGVAKVQEYHLKIAENDIDAMLKMADIYLKQNKPSERKALLESAARLDSMEAKKQLADLLVLEGTPQAIEKAITFYEEAMNSGIKKAYENYHQLYQNQAGIISREEILVWAEKFNSLRYFTEFDKALLVVEDPHSTVKQQVNALETLGDAYLTGRGVHIDKTLAMDYFQQLVDRGEGRGYYKIGRIYEDGKLVDKNLQEAAKWYRLALENKYNGGKDVVKYDDWLIAAKTGDQEARLNLVEYYLSSSTRDIPQALALLEALVQENYPPAQLELANMFFQNPKYEDYYERGFTLLQAAAEANDEEAMIRLANIIQRYPEARSQEEIHQEVLDLLTSHQSLKMQTALIHYLMDHQYFEEADQRIGEVETLFDRISFYQKLIDKLVNSHPSNYKMALAVAEKSLSLDVKNDEDGWYFRMYEGDRHNDLHFTIATLYLAGDATLPQDQQKALENLSQSFERAIDLQIHNERRNAKVSFSGVYDKYAPTAEALIEAKEGFSLSEENHELGLKWLEVLADYNSKKSGQYLYDYFMKNGFYTKAYYYGLVYDLRDLNRITVHLTEKEKEEIVQKAKATQESFKYLPHLAVWNQIKKQAEEGSMRGIHQMGEAYLYDEIIPQDIDKAIVYLEESGKMGYAFSYNRLGNLYRKGNGVPQDMAKAFYYFDLGTQLGDSNCAHQAGELYYFGEGDLESDYVKAIEYFAKTDVTKGKHHALAKFKMAYLYYHATGNVPEDKQKAYDILMEFKEYDSGGDHSYAKALDEWDWSGVKR